MTKIYLYVYVISTILHTNQIFHTNYRYHNYSFIFNHFEIFIYFYLLKTSNYLSSCDFHVFFDIVFWKNLHKLYNINFKNKIKFDKFNCEKSHFIFIYLLLSLTLNSISLLLFHLKTYLTSLILIILNMYISLNI